MQHKYSYNSLPINLNPLEQMVRESDQSSGVTLSSIALLQERFRQLQKMKELRQEKELLRLLSEAERHSPPTIHYNYHEPRSNTFSGSQHMFLPPKPQHCQLGLSLWPDSDIIKQAAPSNRAKSWFNDAPIKLEKSGSDIDTSLHL